MIRSGAFFGCISLTSIVLPNSLTYLGDYAFAFCSGLTTVMLPSSLTAVSGGVFYYCTSLSSVMLPNSLTYLGDRAFAYCSELTSLTIPSSLTAISDLVFYRCSALTTLTLPSCITVVGEYAFYGCSGMTSLTVLNSSTTIGDNAFTDCSHLTLVRIPNKIMIKVSVFLNTTFDGLTGPNCPFSADDYIFNYTDTNNKTSECPVSFKPTYSPTIIPTVQPTLTLTLTPTTAPTTAIIGVDSCNQNSCINVSTSLSLALMNADYNVANTVSGKEARSDAMAVTLGGSRHFVRVLKILNTTTSRRKLLLSVSVTFLIIIQMPLTWTTREQQAYLNSLNILFSLFSNNLLNAVIINSVVGFQNVTLIGTPTFTVISPSSNSLHNSAPSNSQLSFTSSSAGIGIIAVIIIVPILAILVWWYLRHSKAANHSAYVPVVTNSSNISGSSPKKHPNNTTSDNNNGVPYTIFNQLFLPRGVNPLKRKQEEVGFNYEEFRDSVEDNQVYYGVNTLSHQHPA